MIHRLEKLRLLLEQLNTFFMKILTLDHLDGDFFIGFFIDGAVHPTEGPLAENTLELIMLWVGTWLLQLAQITRHRLRVKRHGWTNHYFIFRWLFIVLLQLLLLGYYWRISSTHLHRRSVLWDIISACNWVIVIIFTDNSSSFVTIKGRRDLLSLSIATAFASDINITFLWWNWNVLCCCLLLSLRVGSNIRLLACIELRWARKVF